MQDDLITGVAGGAEREVKRLGRTDRDEDLVRRVVSHAVPTLQVVGQREPQLDRPVVARVVRAPFTQRFHPGLDDHPRRVEVRLPDPQADDVVHGRGDVEEATNA
jgi:hypothetical protein